MLNKNYKTQENSLRKWNNAAVLIKGRCMSSGQHKNVERIIKKISKEANNMILPQKFVTKKNKKALPQIKRRIKNNYPIKKRKIQVNKKMFFKKKTKLN
jgi:hypothetical protein